MTKNNQTYLIPKTVSEALKLAHKQKNDFSYLAGGTDLLVSRFQENNQVNCLIDISKIKDLQQVTTVNQTLKIGALVRLDQLNKFPEVNKNFHSLIEAANAVGSPLVRKTATLGGNLLCENRCIYFNQSAFGKESVNYCLKSGGGICIASGGLNACFSEFISDTAPVLICLNAKIEIEDVKGQQILALEEIYSGDGVFPKQLSSTAILKSILIPLNHEVRCTFKKLRPRKSMDFTSLTTAVSIEKNGKMKIALSGVNPKPVVIEASEGDNENSLIKTILSKCKTVDNDVYSRIYRRKMIEVFLRKSIEELMVNS